MRGNPTAIISLATAAGLSQTAAFQTGRLDSMTDGPAKRVRDERNPAHSQFDIQSET